VVSLSGPDNIGKTTQLRLLHRRLAPDGRLAGSLHEHDPRWAAIVTGGMATWWFTTSTAEELADVLASSYLHRHTTTAGDGLSLFDRGVPMLEAGLAATFSVRFQLDDAEAHRTALRLLRPFQQRLDACAAREIGIVLLHCHDPEASARRSLTRESDVSPTYRRYQHHLARQILRQVDDGRFAHVVEVGDRSIVEVQDELRSILRERQITAPPAILSRATVVAFGGLSESGKSTAAQWLRRRHGYTRLKIGYLLEQAAVRHGIADVYALDETAQAELLVDSLDRYLAAHYYGNRITIESLHRHPATAALQALLGPTLTIVYVDAAEQVRHERSTEAASAITERDDTKRSRGAHCIRDIADLVVANDGPLHRLYHHLDQLAYNLAWPLAAPRVSPPAALGLPRGLTDPVARLVADLSADAAADLIAVTGSGGRGKYQDGWSDLDVLIIASPSQLDRVRAAAVRLRHGIRQVKLGLTLISSRECHAGALTARLIHTLRQIGTGAIAVQWAAPELRLPCPDPDDDALASLADGTHAAVELRRQLLAARCEPRAVFKLAALLAKVTLRLTGDDPPDDDLALRRFLPRHDPHQLAASRTDPDLARTVAVAVLDTWLATLPAPATTR
jgi:cytidylate kinase